MVEEGTDQTTSPSFASSGTGLNLRNQLRFFDVAKRNFHRADAGLPTLAVLLHGGQIQRDGLLGAAFNSAFRGRSRDEPSLPVTVVANRLEGLYFHQAARKPPELLRLCQLAIQTRGTGFQRIFGAGAQVFHVKQYAEIPAELGTILMCDAGKLFGA